MTFIVPPLPIDQRCAPGCLGWFENVSCGSGATMFIDKCDECDRFTYIDDAQCHVIELALSSPLVRAVEMQLALRPTLAAAWQLDQSGGVLALYDTIARAAAYADALDCDVDYTAIYPNTSTRGYGSDEDE